MGEGLHKAVEEEPTEMGEGLHSNHGDEMEGILLEGRDQKKEEEEGGGGTQEEDYFQSGEEEEEDEEGEGERVHHIQVPAIKISIIIITSKYNNIYPQKFVFAQCYL